MIRLVVAILLLTLGVSGQTSNTICTKNETTSFLFNANDESPCLVWSKLQSLCLPQERFINVPPLIDRTWGYNPVMPDEKDSLCQCNVVAYALMAGCSWCQLGDTSSSSWVTEQRWRQDCTTYNETSVSFAQILLPLPTYVFHRWMDLRWDPAAAMAASRGPPTVAPTIATSTFFRSFLPSPTSTLTKPSGSPKPSSPPSDDDLSNQDGKSSPARIGAIIGGVVGGVMLLISIMMLMFAYWKKQHRFQKNQAEGKEGGSEPEYGAGMARRGAPVGLPSFPDPYALGRGGGPTTGIVEMLKTSVQNGRERGTERVSRWSENFFTNPRKAPIRPHSSQLKNSSKSRYTTTTDRRRDKGVSSSTSGGSSFDVTFDRSSALTSETWKGGRDGAVWPQTPHTAKDNAPAMHDSAAMSQRDQAHLSTDTTGTYQQAQNPTRKIAPLSHPRESFAERWPDQSSVFTFGASKANQRETLPFFSTSVNDIKNHRTALAKKVADDEAHMKARDEREWQEAKAMAPDRSGLGDSSESPRNIVLGSGASMKGSKKKTKKSGSRSKTTEEGVDEKGVKLKKTKKRKKRSSNTPGPNHPTSAPTSNRSSIRLSANARRPIKSAFNRRALSAHSVAPSDIPEYANKPLPEPPTPLESSRGAGIDFSAAAQRTPTISTPSQPRPTHPFARIGRRVSTTFSPADRVNFPEPHTAQSRSYPADFPSPAPYNPRSSSSQQMPTSRSALGGTKGRMGEADFSQPRPSPNPTLPSMYEPKTGAGVFDPLIVPPQHDTTRGETQSESDSGTPVSRRPTSVLRIVD